MAVGFGRGGLTRFICVHKGFTFRPSRRPRSASFDWLPTKSVGTVVVIVSVVIFLIYSSIREIAELCALDQDVEEHLEKCSSDLDVVVVADAKRMLQSYIDIGAQQVREDGDGKVRSRCVVVPCCRRHKMMRKSNSWLPLQMSWRWYKLHRRWGF